MRTLVPLVEAAAGATRKSLVTEVETLAARMVAEGKAAIAGVHVIQARDI